jgi:hypothetical protein
MRRHLEVLRVRVRAARKNVPRPAVTVKQLKKIVEEECQRVDNVVAINWKRLQAGVAIEKRLKMPLDCVNRISQQLINATDAYTRADMAALARQKLLGTTPMEDFDPITIDGVRVDQPTQVVNGGQVTMPAPMPAAAQSADKPSDLPPPPAGAAAQDRRHESRGPHAGAHRARRGAEHHEDETAAAGGEGGAGGT